MIFLLLISTAAASLCSLGFQNNNGTCEICAQGRYNTDPSSACQDCPNGFYQPTQGAQQCLGCVSGQYQDEQGAQQCLGCVSGQYQDELSQTECKACPVGYSQVRNSSASCDQCDVGTYSDQAGLAQCTLCPEGTYLNVSGSQLSTDCKACPSNTYFTTQRSFCGVCVEGFKTNGNNSGCEECSTTPPCCIGYAVDQGGLCTACPSGTFAHSSGVCESCPNGYISVLNRINAFTSEYRILAVVNGSNECQQCSPGSEVVENRCTQCSTGKYELNHNCIDCTAGQFKSNVSEMTCSNCPAGFFTANSGQSKCEACPQNTLSVPGSISCTACPSNTVVTQISTLVSTPTTTEITTTVGNVTTVENVTTYVNTTIVQNVTTVSPQFSPLGSVSCRLNCSGFQYVFNDTTNCVYCPAGKYTPLTSITEVGQCQTCPTGFIRPHEFNNTCVECQNSVSNLHGTECEPCPLGTEYFNLSCIDCGAGTFRDNTTDICTNCTFGNYQGANGLQGCLECAAGQFSDTEGADQCIPCPAGYVTNVSATFHCRECPSGRGSFESTDCFDCVFGEESVAGQCVLCPPGKEATSAGVCEMCPYGKVSSTHNTSCVVCGDTLYAKNSSHCETCDASQYLFTNTIGPGSTQCIECLPNTTTLCQTCGPGTYNHNSQCIDCPSGWVNEGQRFCHECGAFLVPNSASTLCEQCPAGQEKHVHACSECATGKFGSNGQCYSCQKGRYQDQTGKLVCKDCDTSAIQTTQAEESDSPDDCTSCVSQGFLTATVILQGSCSLCQPGKYVSEAKDSCILCPNGYHRSTSETICSACPVGKFTKQISDNDGTPPCQNCAAGKYTDEEGQPECKDCTDTTGDNCNDCMAGYKKVSDTCVECEPGTFSVAAQETCQSCGPGFYQDEQTQSFCKSCQPGQYQNEQSGSHCVPCATGRFQPLTSQAACHKCIIGRFADVTGLDSCKECNEGYYTTDEASQSSADCKACPIGYFETQGSCSACPESNYQDEVAQTSCKECLEGDMSAVASTNISDCFSIDGITSYVFGMKNDAQPVQIREKVCEIRPNFLLLCSGCSCDSDSRNGFWDGPICDECQRGFATRTCTVGCPAYDGVHDSTMCNGNGKCWFGKYGNGLCYCGSLHTIDATAENAVVDVRLCPKGSSNCPGYGPLEQTETSYRPIYYLMMYRQYSVFVLQLNQYTPDSGHMWFTRYAPNKAYENTCLSCVSAYENNIQTKVGYWSANKEWQYFNSNIQVKNGFHGENCQYECGLCMNGGKCNNVPHPFRYAYTIEDTFRPQKTVTIPTTTCVCSSVSFDSSNMCCPNGFQPYIFYGVRGSEPYTRFTRTPLITSLENQQREYWINKDILLEIDVDRPYAEPENGQMIVMHQNEQTQQNFSRVGPYNKHIFYGVPRDICRACPGLFGMGVESQGRYITTPEEAETFWWDNAMGAMSRKCNGIGVCDFYKKERETDVHFMGDAQAYTTVAQNKVCNSIPTTGYVSTNNESEAIDTVEKCAAYANQNGVRWFAFTHSYIGGSPADFTNAVFLNEASVIANSVSVGYASFVNNTRVLWTNLLTNNFPLPDSNSVYTISHRQKVCAVFSSCDSYTTYPGLFTHKTVKGHGDSRLAGATFNRFDTCFTFTYEDKISVFGLYVTKEYTQGQDPFLGGLCPKGHFCSKSNNVGYKEPCPAGYYQEFQGMTRTDTNIQCSTQTSQHAGCQPLASTLKNNDYVDLVCKRCPRNMWSAAGSSSCTECPLGRVKKLSGQFDTNTTMINFPTSVSKQQVWYYQEDEQGLVDTDCAFVPEAIIHIPAMNQYMRYDIPTFFPVLSCPYGYSSRVGSSVYVNNEPLISLLISKVQNMENNTLESITNAPYMKLKKTYSWKTSDAGVRCSDMISNDIISPVSTAADCSTAALETLGIETVVLRSSGIRGCYIVPSVSTSVAFFGVGPSNPCLHNVQYLCQQGINNDELLRDFVISNCFRCPGNTISGPESGACVTCHANQMKWYAKAAIQQGAELSLTPGSFLQVSSATAVEIPNTAIPIQLDLDRVQNIVLSKTNTYQNGWTGSILRPSTDISDQPDISLDDCYLQCQFTDLELKAIAVRQVNPAAVQQQYNGPLCYCVTDGTPMATDQSSIDGILWYQKSAAPVNDWHQEAQPLCFACQPGKKKDGGQCVDCAVGYFTSTSREANLAFCNPCHPGLYQDTPGQSACKTCPQGFFQAALGQDECTGCPAGRFQSGSGTTGCTKCEIGQYQNIGGQLSCNDCATGQSQNSVGSSACEDCTPGRYQDTTRQSACKPCHAGTASSDGGRQFQCQACSPGQYRTSTGGTSCAKCAKGKYEEASGATLDCKSCDKGTGQKGYTTTEGASACTRCPGGQVCSRTGGAGTSCTAGSVVPVGTYANSCTQCEAGKGANSVGTSCEDCDSGKYSTLGSGCTNCPAQGFNGLSHNFVTYPVWKQYWNGDSNGGKTAGTKADFSAFWIAQTDGKRKMWGKFTDDRQRAIFRVDGGGTYDLNLRCCKKSTSQGHKTIDLTKGDTGTLHYTCLNINNGPFQCYFGIHNVGDESRNDLHLYPTKPPAGC